MPKKSHCTLEFLQLIITEQKEFLFVKEKGVVLDVSKAWPEFCVKNAYDKIKKNTVLLKYLPHVDMDKGKLVDKDFFWTICFTVAN